MPHKCRRYYTGQSDGVSPVRLATPLNKKKEIYNGKFKFQLVKIEYSRCAMSVMDVRFSIKYFNNIE